MLAHSTKDSALAAQSFVDWWKMAGVEYIAGDEPMNWLEETPAPVTTVAAKSVPAPRGAPVIPVTSHIHRATAVWPDTLEALITALESGQVLPGNQYAPVRAIPSGTVNPAYMVISDYPEGSELEVGIIGAIPLLQNMLRAANIPSESCFFTALACTRPASEALRADERGVLGEFMRHQIALVKPKRLLLLGSNATEILFGKELKQARRELPIINHNVGKMAAFATFHPRTLAARPVLKAQAWRDLQMLMQEDSA